MRWDLTINVPLILALLTIGAGVTYRFAALETVVRALQDWRAAHEAENRADFQHVSDRLHRVTRHRQGPR